MLSRTYSRLRRKLSFLLCCATLLAPAARARDSGPKWRRVSSAHFAMLTDADEKRATQAMLRLEQMRAVFGQLLMKARLNFSEPLDIIGFSSRDEYLQVAPLRGGQVISASGYFLPGADRNYIVLDLSDSDSWRPISRQLAAYLLYYNYPPTQPWFDEGLTQYFSSLRLDDREVRIGEDPASFVPQLLSQPWLPLPELFAVRQSGNTKTPAIFEAESWIVMHYLLSQDKLSETGTYLGLVELKKLPPDESIQQAYGMPAAQLEQAVKDYFHAIAPALQSPAAGQAASGNAARNPVQEFPTPVAPLDVGTSAREVLAPEANALIDEVALRVPERRAQVVDKLQALVASPPTETAVAHRALAWAFLQDRNYDEAEAEIGNAADLDKNDLWVHYYRALAPYQQALATSKPTQHLANVMQDLHAALDLYLDFAEAYNMLAMAQLEGGGTNAALGSIRFAIGLSPRNQSYLLNEAKIYLAGKKWDDATALLDRLKDSQDKQIASAARQDLEDLPTLKKYGILPQRSAETAPAPKAEPAPKAQSEAGGDEEGSGEESSPPAQPGPDLRKSVYLQGKLLAVDCSQAPVATLKVAAKARTLRLRTDDYKSLLLVGADQFSCDWKNVSVVVNYKAGGKADGDLVSLEIQ